MTIMSGAAAPSDLECVEDARRASVLLHPLRLRILGHAREPVSASAIGAAIGLPRQKVNYHLRELLKARFVRRAGDRKKRNMLERRFVATARAYFFSPRILAPVRPRDRALADRASAAYLVSLAADVQSETARAMRAAEERGQRVATLALDAEIRFETADQRARFAEALERAVAEVVARHASPARRTGGAAAPGRPFRLVLLCHPILRNEEESFP